MRDMVLNNPLLAIMRNIPDEKLLSYAGAIVDGGVSFFEVALNTPTALQQIATLRRHFGDRALIGAGTAITVERARAAIDAGAQFLLSPSTNEDVLSYCEQNKIEMLPGALTPTDVTVCMRHGFYTIKLFPAADMPTSYVKNLKGPLDGTEYVAIGGINRSNMADFLSHGYIGVGLGSNIMPKNVLSEDAWDEGSRYVSEMLSEIKKVRG